MTGKRKHTSIAATAVVLACALAGAPLHAAGSDLLAAADKGDVARVRALLGAGADVNAKTSDGSTTLMGASMDGNLEVVRALVAAKADVNAKANNGETALKAAAEFRHPKVVQLLKDAGAVDRPTTTP